MTDQMESTAWAALVIPVRDEMHRAYGRLACINAVGALIDVAKALGLGELRPLTVRASVFNPTLTQRVGDVSSPDAGERIKRWATESGSLMVAVGMGEVPAGEWAGHLVAIGAEPAGGKHLLLDATI